MKRLGSPIGLRSPKRAGRKSLESSSLSEDDSDSQAQESGSDELTSEEIRDEINYAIENDDDADEDYQPPDESNGSSLSGCETEKEPELYEITQPNAVKPREDTEGPSPSVAVQSSAATIRELEKVANVMSGRATISEHEAENSNGRQSEVPSAAQTAYSSELTDSDDEEEKIFGLELMGAKGKATRGRQSRGSPSRTSASKSNATKGMTRITPDLNFKRISGISVGDLRRFIQQIVEDSKSDLSTQILLRDGLRRAGQDSFLWPFPLTKGYFDEIINQKDYLFSKKLLEEDSDASDPERDILFSDEEKYSDSEGDDDVVDIPINKPKSASLLEFSGRGFITKSRSADITDRSHGKQSLNTDDDDEKKEEEEAAEGDDDDDDDGQKSVPFENRERNITNASDKLNLFDPALDFIPLDEYASLYWQAAENNDEMHSLADDPELGQAIYNMISRDIQPRLPGDAGRRAISSFTKSVVSAEVGEVYSRMWEALCLFRDKRFDADPQVELAKFTHEPMSWINVLQAAMMCDIPNQ
ncbi:hypothetical protein EV182_004873 [Spiromyces aspiralis]|uniref:Uncharacterized protein n=1 Tax=Spiromyces aspiralis TaxID=68401 RepID=A0ACC1HAP3_9FUNG|nr:hypothetical protein EV182_004873 [Spiromyces aspiralis]